MEKPNWCPSKTNKPILFLFRPTRKTYKKDKTDASELLFTLLLLFLLLEFLDRAAAAAAIGAAVVAGCSVMLLAFPPDRFLVKADRLDFLFHRLHVGVVGRLEPEAGEAERVFELSVAEASANWKERKLGCH